MFMDTVEVIGGLAAITSSVSLIPQITKIMGSKSAQDLSYLMLANFLITSVLWVAYGFMIESAAVWGCNLFMTLTAVLLTLLKVRFG
jgi:MtN3 and saliva related transmembrane protein